MITEQQAREVVIRERSTSIWFPIREVQIESLEYVTVTKEDPQHGGDEMGIVEWEPMGWSVNFAYRDQSRDGGWDEWYHGHCYVVEAKPGPYVIK